MSMKQLAEHYGVGQTAVFNRIKEHGIVLDAAPVGGHRKTTGKVFTAEHIENLRKANTQRAAAGSANPNWKGGSAVLHCRLWGKRLGCSGSGEDRSVLLERLPRRGKGYPDSRRG